MAIAFFDIEGTVLDGDLSRGFVSEGRKAGLFGRGTILGALGYLLLMRLAPKTRRPNLRWRALLRLVKGHTRDEIIRTGRAGVPTIRPLFKPELLQRIAAHRAVGDTVVLISGGMHEAAQVVAEEVGADRGEGTRCEMRGNTYTGRLDGPLCTGENKAARARQVAAELGVALADCVAYGDSVPDIPMLAGVGRAYAVDPDAGLAEEARRRGWEVIRTKE